MEDYTETSILQQIMFIMFHNHQLLIILQLVQLGHNGKALGTRARRAHTPRAMVHCECYCTDGFDPGEIRSIEHAQDSLVQACAVVSKGVSGIGVATMGNKKALFVTLVDHISRFEAY